jgi:catechol 2,3-dioxygenase-like lactoylglutathione lyase family enzyme
MSVTVVSVRYMIDDVEAAIAFYTTHLGFTLESNAAPAFAAVTRGSLRLLLSATTTMTRVKPIFRLRCMSRTSFGARLFIRTAVPAR